MSAFIGISLGFSSSREEQVCLKKDYIQAVREAGGVPFLLPPVEKEYKFDLLKNKFDGFMLSGGGDVAPRYFGESPQKGMRRVDPLRDNYEIKLCQWVINNDIPLLAICRGMQVLNIACGGGIIQDLADSNYAHEQNGPGYYASHDIEIMADTILSNIFRGKNARVNSFHHQAISGTGKELQVAARAGDGVIEAIYSPVHRFVLGVQWHPERMFEKDEIQLDIFKKFVASCR